MAMKNYSKLANVNAGGVPEDEYNKLKERYGVRSSLDNYTVANTLNANKIDATNNGGDTTGLATPMANTTQPLNNNAINNYNQALQEGLEKQNANVETQRANDLRQAQINYQLMMKYLPEQVKYSGLGNDGNSAQFYLNANNQYQNNLANINSNADQTLNNNYANYYDKLASNQKELEQRDYEREQSKQETLSGIYNYLVEQIKDENGKLDQEAYNELLDTARKYGLSEDNINSIKAANDLSVYQTENEKTDIKIQNDLEKYGIKDVNAGIDVAEATVKSFPKWWSGSYKGGKQDKWVETIIELAKDGKIPDGTLVDFNYGNGLEFGTEGDVYRYYNGKFYKTNKSRNKAEIDYDNYKKKLKLND